MKPEEIHLGDWQRILVGEVPINFYLEIVIRLILVFLILMVSMRLMGKRMAGQMSRTELVALVSLAAAVGVPVITPDRGILPAAIIAFVIVLGERIITWQAAKNERFEAMAEDELDTLVEDGVMKLPDMKQTRITRERLFAQLRSEGLYHLGSVKRLYLEAGGSFSLIKEPNPKPGLSVVPLWDTELLDRQKKLSYVLVCTSCGTYKASPANSSEKCKNCGNEKWVQAVE